MNIQQAISLIPASLKSIAKIILLSRRPNIPKITRPQDPFIIMGNGPSLADDIKQHFHSLTTHTALAVNFAANAPEFFSLKPAYYVLADPLFFPKPGVEPAANVAALTANLAKVNWPMTLFVPCRHKKQARELYATNPAITIATFNPIGIDGWQWLRNFAYRTSLGMPRPRNVLIPSIMIAISMGCKQIYIAGADHSWMKTISVDEENHVVSIQPHFYRDDDKELTRVRTEYLKHPLHSIVYSFYLAFKAYHEIQRYAITHGIRIHNSTPGSFIDAFPRSPLP